MTSSQSPILGIVIVSFRNHSMTADFVNHELAKLTMPFKVAIIDNASSEEKSRELSQLCNDSAYVTSQTIGDTIDKTKKVFILNSPENLGFAKGNNKGVQFLKKYFNLSHLLFTNDDINLKDENTVEDLIQFLDRNNEYAIVGPRVIGVDGQDQSPHYRKITPFRQIGWKLLWFMRSKKTIVNQNTSIKPKSGNCYWVSGCFLIVRACDFDEVGGFDPRTFLYCEEVILSERMKKINKNVYFYADKEVLHLGGCSTKQLTNKTIHNTLVESNCIYYLNYLKSNKFIVWLYKQLYKL